MNQKQIYSIKYIGTIYLINDITYYVNLNTYTVSKYYEILFYIILCIKYLNKS